MRSEVILSYRKFNGQFATDADQSPLNEQTVDGRQAFQSRTAEAASAAARSTSSIGRSVRSI